jgi:aminocarboxymuconate-semialdehyde decarboxylase
VLPLTALKVDVHGHIVPPAVLGTAGEFGPWVSSDPDGRIRVRVGDREMNSRPISVREEWDRTGALRPESDPFRRMSDPELRIREMDERGIDVMVVTALPHFFFYWADARLCDDFSRRQNDAMAEWCSIAPKRLAFLANVPLQDSKAAAKEARRAIDQLGARGVNLGVMETGGFELDREDLYPLYEVLSSARLPLWLHPAPLTLAPDAPPKRYFADQIVVFPYLVTKALFELLMGGVLERFDGLNVCAAHGGGFLPYQIGRVETMSKVSETKRSAAPLDGTSSVYYDNLIHDRRARRLLVEVAGPDHVVVGDNYSGMDSADGFAMLEELGLPEADAVKIAGANAAQLFQLCDGPSLAA